MKILKDLKCYKHAPTIVKSRRRRRRRGRRAEEFVMYQFWSLES
jgi:hypothetical protein